MQADLTGFTSVRALQEAVKSGNGFNITTSELSITSKTELLQSNGVGAAGLPATPCNRVSWACPPDVEPEFGISSQQLGDNVQSNGAGPTGGDMQSPCQVT